MNAIATPIIPANAEPVTSDVWAAHHTAVNLWRGRCLHLFARAEAAVSEALLLLAKSPANEVILPLMVRPRFDELDRLLAKRDDPPGKAALNALRRLRPYSDMRVFLCHGVATVLTDQRGNWHVVFELIAFKGGLAVRDELFITNEKAMARYKALNADTQRLGQRLTALSA